MRVSWLRNRKQGAHQTKFERMEICGISLMSEYTQKELHKLISGSKRIWLFKADLSNCILIRAPLQKAMLSRANLQEADLYEANLKGASLRGTNLTRANLKKANLKKAD